MNEEIVYEKDIQIQLPKDFEIVVDELGGVNAVAEKALELCECGVMDYFQESLECLRGTEKKHYRVGVKNAEYLQLLNSYGEHNKRYSLSRIVYYYIANELYQEYPPDKPTEEPRDKAAFCKVLQAINKVPRKGMSNRQLDELDELQRMIKEYGEKWYKITTTD